MTMSKSVFYPSVKTSIEQLQSLSHISKGNAIEHMREKRGTRSRVYHFLVKT